MSVSDQERKQLESVYEELAQLNAEYEAKFGFRFVVFVNGRSKAQLIPVLKARLQRTREQELAEGLQAMIDIAYDRLQKLERLASPTPQCVSSICR